MKELKLEPTKIEMRESTNNMKNSFIIIIIIVLM